MHPSECFNSFNTISFCLKFSLRFLILYALTFVILLSLLFAVYSLHYLFRYVFHKPSIIHIDTIFNATKYVSYTFFNATKVTLISYFFIVSIFQRFVTKSFAPSLSLYFVKRRLLLPHLQPFPPLWGTFAPFRYIKNEFAVPLYEGM